MIKIQEKNKCNGCKACIQKCKFNALSLNIDDEGFWYPSVNEVLCQQCGVCVKVCPELNPVEVSNESKIYAAYCTDYNKRMESASGGIFALIAETILCDDGVVYGAAFDENWCLKHVCVTDKEELVKLKGSKYIQSDIGNTFQDAERYLKQGVQVLFSGTPCQIQGLKKYLGKDYNNLMTIDLFCHGVPSPEVWRDYVSLVSKERRLVGFSQRDKTHGVSKAPMVFTFDNGDVEIEKYTENLFVRGFIDNLYLRPSCYDCSFKGINRCSDITLGDFWGIEKEHPGFSDDYGVSAVIIHTEKGKGYFARISDHIEKIESTIASVTKENPCVIEPVTLNPKRNDFFVIWKKVGLKKAIKKLTKRRGKRLLFEFYHNLRHWLWLIKRKLTNNH